MIEIPQEIVDELRKTARETVALTQADALRAAAGLVDSLGEAAVDPHTMAELLREMADVAEARGAQ